MKQSGFSLLEIMIVVTIIGILTAMVAVNLGGKDDQAKVAAAQFEIKNIDTALMMFKLDNGRFPSSTEGLEALVVPPDDVKNWPQNGYLASSTVPLDPWENPYDYLGPEEGNGTPVVISYGADGVEDGEGFNADITNQY